MTFRNSFPNGGTMYRNHRWLAAAAIALLATACAQTGGDVNRVQPNVMKKTDLLDGVWYFRNTVTWTPATTGFTFAGETGNIEKLVWELQENFLIGYRAYPFILGAERNVEPSSKPSGTTMKVMGPDGKWVGGQKYFGAPVVAYPIKSHFDIQRNYNPATGEPGNVIMENPTDRPWNQREYIRVDWSANLLNQSADMMWNTIQNPSGDTSWNAWIQPNEPGTDPYDWPTQEFGADGKLTYMDFTGRYMAKADQVHFEDEDGNHYMYPYCFFLQGYRYDCSNAEIRMRTSIAKVDPNTTNDYEPLVYPNDVMAKFGYFRTERLNYDRKYGPTESARIFLANRHRLWKTSFEKNASGAPDPKRPIPFVNREVKPIVYYVSPADRMGAGSSYQEYLEAARILEKNWDKAYRRAVAAAKFGKDDPATLDAVGQVFFVCENPVPAGAPQACGKPNFEPKFGDLRYNFIYTITDPVPNGLLGYGPSSADPETGEIISANANTYSAAVDTIAQRGLDIIDMLVGERSIDQIIRGEDVKAYITANLSYANPNRSKQGLIQSELQGIPQTAEETLGAFERPTERTAAVLQALRVNGLPEFSSDRMKAAADLLKQNPALESALLDNPDVQADVVGLLPPELAQRAETDSDFRRSASRLVLTRVGDALKLSKRRVEWASKRNIYLAEFFDRPMLGLAYQEHFRRQKNVASLMAEGKLDRDGVTVTGLCKAATCTADEARRIADEEIRRRFRKLVWRATSEHEVGHTLGLRHNFQGSFDSVNYFDRYWEVKKPSLTVQQSGTPKIPRTPGDLKAASDGTEVQLAQGLNDYEYSSIMDYAGKLNADFQGVGKYDEAAIVFAYSGDTKPGYVEVFESARRDPASFPGTDGKQMTITGAAFDLPLVNAEHRHQGIPSYTERYHFSTVPLHFGEGNDIESTIADGIAKLKRRKLMKWADVKVENDRLAAILKTNPAPTASDVGSTPMEVPYLFCSDSEVGLVLSCNRFDRGPDYFEISRQMIEDYWNDYFFTHFKRDRYLFSSSSAFNNAAGTFYELASIYKHWVHAFYGQSGPNRQNVQRFNYDPLIQDTWSMAVLDASNANLAVMSVPPAGFFMFRNLSGRGQWDYLSEGVDFDELSPEGQQKLMDYYSDQNTWGSAAAQAFAIMKRGHARRMYSRYDFKSGFGFWYRMLEAGHYNDQIGAMIAAVLPEAEFPAIDYYADRDRYYIPYYLVFKKEFSDLFSALWGMDETPIRPTMYLAKDDTGKVTSTPALHFRTFIEGKNFIKNFDYPKRKDLICTATQTTDCLDASQYPGEANMQLTWSSRIYALYLGMALFSINYDLDYAKSNMVFKIGGSETVTPATGYHTVEVPDISTGSRYVALEKDGAAPNSTPPIRLINIADAYRKVVENPAICPMPELPNPYGPASTIGSCMPADERNNPVLIEQRRREYLEYFKDMLRDLDLARGFYGVFGRAF
ncbi:MAG: zinc-dependent metalloprotease [Myxococcales bacterium]|nr:zinc-dependent metalloprotease [Myxococcales bacterium]